MSSEPSLAITREDMEKAQKVFNERTMQSPFCNISLNQSRFAKIVIGKGTGAIKITNVDDKEYKFELLEDVEIFLTRENPIASRGPVAVAEERLLQLAQFMVTLTIDGAKVEEAFRKMLLVAPMHDDFTEYPECFYKKKKDKPTWSPGFGAPVRRRKK